MPNPPSPPAAKPPKARRRSRAEIVERIVQAASEEFKQRGFSDATTAAIAQRAGVSESLIFRYFGSKTNLFRETVFDPLAHHLAEFAERFFPEGTGYPYATDLQRFLRQNIGLFKSLVAVETFDAGAAHGVGEVDSLRAYFQRGEAALRDWAGGAPQVDPALMVRISFVAVLANIMFRDWIFPEGLAGEAEITDAINRFVMGGVNAVKPQT